MSLNAVISRALARLPAACDARRWSLTTRMTVFFSCAIAAILLLVSAMMYHELVHQLHEKEEIEIRDAVRVELKVLGERARAATPDQWQRGAAENVEQGRRFAWRLLAADGAELAASRAMATPRAAFAAANPRGKFKRRATQVDGVDQYYLLVAQLATAPSGAGWVVQGALDVSEDQRVVERYFVKLSGALSGAIVLSALIAWLLARRSLAPLRAISAAIGDVDAERLDARIAHAVWPADLRVLAHTFDAMLARLATSFEQLSRFSSDLAHEFRTPINNLVAAASVTLTRARAPAEYQETLAVIVDEGERLSRMVSSMLFLARADKAKQVLALESLSCAEQFDKVIDFFDAAAEDAGVTLSATGDVRLLADPLLLRRALSNLIANALHHTPPGGAVTLDARAQGDSVVLCVSDSGAGIAADHLPHVFDRFYRADAARSASDSSGLGLALVRSIVELHGGAVSVDSRVGEGARFTLVFPQRAVG